MSAKLRMTKVNPRFLQVFKTAAIKATAREMRQLAEDLSDEVKATIETQRYLWRPLNPKYRAWKSKRGLDTRILIATRKYIDSIRVLRFQTRGQGVTYTVGFDPAEHHEGMSMETLARVHEYGTSRIPARPLWRPVWSAFLRRLPKTTRRVRSRIQARITADVKRRLGRPR